MAEISSTPHLVDPLGAPRIATGPEYLDALAKLGYNAENLNSNIPFALATTKAASSLITNQYDQAMQWQKAQADMAETMARAKNYDSVTKYNNDSLQLRLAGLDQENKQRDLNLALDRNKLTVSNATIDAAIDEARNKAQNEDLLVQANQFKLQTDQRNADLARKAQDEQKQALAELPTMDDPDYFQKKAESIRKYPNAWTNQLTSQSMVDAYGSLEQGMKTNAAVMQRNKYMEDLQKAKDAGTLPGNADIHDLSLRPDAANNAIVQSRITGQLQQAQRIINRLPTTVAPEYQRQASDLVRFRDQLKAILGDREQGMASVTSGFHSDLFDTNGNLNPELQGDLQALEDYTSQVSKEGAKAMGTINVHQGIGTPDPLTGKYQSFRDYKETVPVDQMQQRMEELEKQVGPGGSVTADKTSHSGGKPTQGTTGAQQQQQISNALAQRMTADPGFRTMVEQAQRTGNWLPVYQVLGAAPGMQEGGLVGTRTGLMKQQGGIIFNPAQVTAESKDTVPIMAAPNEYVVNAGATAIPGVKDTLDQINRLGQVSSSPNIKDPLGDISQLVQQTMRQRQQTADKTQAKDTTAQPTSQDVTPWWGGKSATPWYGSAAQPQEPKSVSQPSETPQSIVPEAAAAAAAARTPSQVEPTHPIGGNWTTGIGTEFGEVDNPVYGGYTEAGWNRGKWGDNISGWDTEGVALPNVPHGTVVEVMNPKTGQTVQATVKDAGPGAGTGAAIDLLAGTRAKLGLPRNFKGQVQFRIVRGPTETAQGYQQGGAVTAAPSPAQVEPNYPIGAGSDPLIGQTISGAQITRFGYAGDAYWDKNSGMGIGDRGNQLQHGLSVALSVPMRTHLFPDANPSKSTGKTFSWGGQNYRDDDSTDKKITDMRIDVYDPTHPGLDRGVTAEMAASRRKLMPQYAQAYQRGGLVSEEGSIGTRGQPRAGGTGGGIESQLDAPVDPRQRHRRFHPRVGAAGGLGGFGADIPDPMQKKLAKLSQGYLSGLSDLIQQSPELGPALLHHARHQLAANMGGQPGDWMAEGGGTEQQQMRQAAPSVPPEAYGGGMTAYGGSGGGGEEGSYMRRGGPVGYQAGGPVMPEDVMNQAMLDPEAFGLGNMQRGGLVRPTHHSNLLTAAYQGLYR